ncbi:MAG: DUF5658 family protein [Desulfitobacteriaceae bacterium]
MGKSNSCSLFSVFYPQYYRLDGALTLWGLSLGTVEEANPIMQWLITRSTIAFMIVKLSLPVILGLVSWRLRNKSRRLVKYGWGLVLILYVMVTMSHVYWIIRYSL